MLFVQDKIMLIAQALLCAMSIADHLLASHMMLCNAYAMPMQHLRKLRFTCAHARARHSIKDTRAYAHEDAKPMLRSFTYFQNNFMECKRFVLNAKA